MSLIVLQKCCTEFSCTSFVKVCKQFRHRNVRYFLFSLLILISSIFFTYGGICSSVSISFFFFLFFISVFDLFLSHILSLCFQQIIHLDALICEILSLLWKMIKFYSRSVVFVRVPMKSFSLAIVVSSTSIFKILFAYKNQIDLQVTTFQRAAPRGNDFEL